MGDGEAVENVLGGNRGMFEVIVRRCNPLLYRLGMGYLKERARTEDAMQNAFVKAFQNLDKYRGGASFSTWLARIMINECLMALRRLRRPSENTVDIDSIPGGIAAPQAADRIRTQEMKALLEKAVQALPRSYRAVYILREVQQVSVAQAAACLGISPESVKVRLFRAREKLRTEILRNAEGVELFTYPACYCGPMTDRVMRAVSGGLSGPRL